MGKPARHQVEEPADHGAGGRASLPAAALPGVWRAPSWQATAAGCPSAFGPRLQAAVATVSVRNRVSRDDAVELCEELFGARISSGSVDAILTRVADALAEPHADLLGRLRSSRALNMDETGWRPAGTDAHCGASSTKTTPTSRWSVTGTRITREAVG